MNKTLDDWDTCDRCGHKGTIHVGWTSETGYDGLCDRCLDTRQQWTETSPPTTLISQMLRLPKDRHDSDAP